MRSKYHRRKEWEESVRQLEREEGSRDGERRALEMAANMLAHGGHADAEREVRSLSEKRALIYESRLNAMDRACKEMADLALREDN